MARRRGNGEGSITRHKKSGLYMARYTVETPTGSKRRTIYADTRKAARDFGWTPTTTPEVGLRRMVEWFDARDATVPPG